MSAAWSRTMLHARHRAWRAWSSLNESRIGSRRGRSGLTWPSSDWASSVGAGPTCLVSACSALKSDGARDHLWAAVGDRQQGGQ